MKLGPVNRLDKRNKTNTKFDDDIMLTNCDLSHTSDLEDSVVEYIGCVRLAFTPCLFCL